MDRRRQKLACPFLIMTNDDKQGTTIYRNCKGNIFLSIFNRSVENYFLYNGVKIDGFKYRVNRFVFPCGSFLVPNHKNTKRYGIKRQNGCPYRLTPVKYLMM